METIFVLGKLVAVLFLVFLNGFFVAAEFAIVKVRSTQIEPLVKEGDRRAQVAQHVISHLDAYLSATQLGITIASLGLGWLGEPFVAQLIEPVAALAGITEPTVLTAVSFAVGFSFITFLHIVLGELAPKSLAIQRARATTLITARPLHIFFYIFRPFITVLNGTANYFLRLGGLQPVTESELVHSEEELRLLLGRGKTISSTTQRILLRTMELRDRTVREVMIPRTEIVYLLTESTLEENIRIALENQFTRYPLCEGNLDNILGMIHQKDLFRLRTTNGAGSDIAAIRRELLYVPETMALERILNLFLTKRVLMAIAVDEYGGTAGLITLEDVLEELVGEIRDEFDTEPIMVHKISETEYVVDGTLPLHDFSRMFEVKPESKEVVSVSGYVIQRLGRVPDKGASFEAGNWDIAVEAMEGKKVKAVRLRRVSRDTSDGKGRRDANSS